MRAAGIVARRELAALVGRPQAWILGGTFAVLGGYLFYSEVAFFEVFGGNRLTTGLWPFVFLDLRLVAFFVVPLLTMRLVAEERQLGTFELLCALPVRDGAIVAGKFAAAYTAFLAMVATTLPGPIVLHLLRPFDWGPLVAGYCGLLLLGAVFVACGLAASAASQSQMASAMLTYGVLAFSWYASWNEAALSDTLTPLVRAVSLFDHYAGFAQGVLDSRSVAYFAGVTLFFLFLAMRALGVRAWRGIG
ncbi:MAG TPA: ABC transporter permease subunit [Candidatus Limnocylindria bacterium]|nr:ABC transporter permease subunit [Candidatus Limnocylindria bacterium]